MKVKPWTKTERCRIDANGRVLKVRDKVRVADGYFSGKLWKRGVPGVITKFTSCGVAEVKLTSSAGGSRGELHDIETQDLTRRR